MTNTIGQKRLKELLDYDQESGIFKWKTYRSHNAMPGDIAGTKIRFKSGHTEYIRICVDCQMYLAHRLAWLYVYGEWPEQIDHINRIGSDNWILNLRESNPVHNSKNTKLSKSNKSGIHGVYWIERVKGWRSEVTVGRKTKYLGYSKSFLDACCMRKSEEYKLGYDENHGR